MRCRCAVAMLKDYPKGFPLGYGRTWVTPRPTRIALLPVGYADGYSRACSNRAEVLIQGRRYPVVGRVSMDHTMVDITDCPGVAVGSEVTLLGRDGDDLITIDELAGHADTLPYCITCGLGNRPGRVHLPA